MSQTSNQTQTQTQIYTRIDIDLSKLYEYLIPSNAAASLLRLILSEYEGGKAVAFVNLSPDIGIDVESNDKRYMIRIEKIFEKLDNVDDAIDKVAKMIDADLVIVLNDGYEIGVAFIQLEMLHQNRLYKLSLLYRKQ